ncbi:MAG: heme o synthase [Synechococcales cyanobacterium]
MQQTSPLPQTPWVGWWASAQATVKAYWDLVKPKIIFLLLVTTAGAMWLAGNGHVDPLLLAVTLTGGALASASAHAINMVYDRDIDEVMPRTHTRPMPQGQIRVRSALIFALVLAVAAFVLLHTYANLLSALLAMSGIVFYVGIYTHWLKRTTTQNIVIGGAAGAIPPLVGWAAVAGSLDTTAWVLFTIIFLWTPPHFWALAILKKEDYAKAGIPMLPVVKGNLETARQMRLYTLALLAASVLLVYPLGVMGYVYGLAALGLGLAVLAQVEALMRDPEDRVQAKRVFMTANTYLLLLYGAMALDSSLPDGAVLSAWIAHLG